MPSHVELQQESDVMSRKSLDECEYTHDVLFQTCVWTYEVVSPCDMDALRC